MTTPRSDYIGSSDAKRILDGDWLALYQEKIGERPAEDLSHNFPVQLGIHTEKFHLDWLEFHDGFSIRRNNHTERMPGHPAIAASIDGWSKTHDTFVEVKHSNARASRETMVDWYQPQIAHMCNVFDRASGILSYIAGNQAPDWFTMEPSERYREALLEMELAFWWHIENREPPNVLIMEPKIEHMRKAAKEVKLDGMRTVDMNLNNQWAVHATDYLLNEGAAVVFEKSKKALKEMVEPDVREARGMGICIKRSKAGSLTISMEK